MWNYFTGTDITKKKTHWKQYLGEYRFPLKSSKVDNRSPGKKEKKRKKKVRTLS